MEQTNINDTVQDINNDDFQIWVHKFGRKMTALSLLAMFAIPFLSGVITGEKVEISVILVALASMAPFIIIGATESFSYAPIMAASGTYIGFITGRTNVCFGPITSQLQKHNIEANSKKHEIISSIVVGTIALTTVIIMVMALFLLNYITPFLENPVLQPGYDNMMSAMIGAFAVPMIIKAPKIALSPGLILVLLTLVMGSAKVIGIQSALLPIMLVVGLVINFGLYKMNFFAPKSKK